MLKYKTTKKEGKDVSAAVAARDGAEVLGNPATNAAEAGKHSRTAAEILYPPLTGKKK